MSLLVLAALATPAHADPSYDVCEEPGATSVLATMPVTQASYPPTGATYPEGVGVIGDRVIVSGPANFGTAGNGSPSQLTVFDRDTGALRAQVPLVGEDLDQEHALSELAVKGNHAYAPSTQLGVLRWKFNGNHDAPAQESVSTPFCSVSIPYPCIAPTDACPSDVRFGLPPLPNGIAVADDGDVYVTDSLQGIVWRVHPHGGAAAEPEVLYCSSTLQGSGTSGLGLFGANGIAVVGDDLYVAVTFGPPDASGAPTSGIYRMDRADPVSMELVYTYSGVAVAPGIVVPPIADGLRYDPELDHLLVVLGGQNAVSELDLGGNVTEVARYGGTDPDMPFFNPSTVALGEGGTAYVSNHAITCCMDGDPNPECTCFGAEDYFGVLELCRE